MGRGEFQAPDGHRPTASSRKFVLFKSYGNDYTTNLPLEACNDADVLLTYKWNGRPLTKEHGGPVRMIIPKRYAWKGAKWIKEITFSDRDEKGFWVSVVTPIAPSPGKTTATAE